MPWVSKGGDVYQAARITINLDTEEITLEGSVQGTLEDKGSHGRPPGRLRTRSPEGPDQWTVAGNPLPRGTRQELRPQVRPCARSPSAWKAAKSSACWVPTAPGKTTVFYMVVGFIRPTSGRIWLNGQDVTGLPMYRRARLGISYLPAGALDLPQALRGGQHPCHPGDPAEPQRQEKSTSSWTSSWTTSGITALRRQKAYTLSGGERRRTEIARSLAIEPKFLLLDEPFAGIDPITVSELKCIVQGLSERGIGVLITDHNVRDTLQITHRSHIINRGEILVSGTREELLASEVARSIYLGHEFEI